MRVLVLTAYFPPDVGGAPRLVEQFVDHLIERGHEVEVVAIRTLPDVVPADVEYRVHRVRQTYVTAKGMLTATAVAMRIALVGLIRRRRVDAIVCGVAYPCSLMALLLRTLLRIPYVIYSHGEDVSIVGSGSPRAVRIKTRLLARSFERAAVAFANSTSTVGLITDLGVPADRIEVFPPTIDAHAYRDVDAGRLEAFRSTLGLRGKRVLFTVARLTSPRKGHDVVVRAISQLVGRFDDLHYVVVGGGDQTALRAVAETAGVGERLSILEHVSEDELRMMYQVAELYVMPSRWDPQVREIEGFGMVYLEAAASGRAAIGGSVGGAAEAIVDGVTGLTVPPDSVDAVAAAIESLLADPARAATMGAAGRRRVESQFARELLLPRIDTAVLDAASRPARR